MRRIDAHQHFWRLSRGDYGWLTPTLSTIYRDFLPDDLAPHLRANEITGTILVQAAPSDAETDFLLSLAWKHSFIEGVVGWIDFGSPNAARRIAALARYPKFKGLRPMIQDIKDPDWMLRRELEGAFTALVGHDLTFDALVLPRHLDNLVTLLERYPRMRVVVHHCAKPEFTDIGFTAWAGQMKRLATATSAFCKLSGLVTEAGAEWDTQKLRPYVDHVLDVFGAERLVWGSDWPVCLSVASYQQWVEATDVLLSSCSTQERAGILGGNAVRAYRLEGGFSA